MKIISKYNDFYDSYGYTLGTPDESIIYVRKEHYADEKLYQHIYKQLNYYCVTENISYYRNYAPTDYQALLNTVIVGIYPYIYLCPFYIIKEARFSMPIMEIKPITVSEEHIHNKNYYEKIYTKVRARFNEYCKERQINGKLFISEIKPKSRYFSDLSYSYTEKPWKIENRDIFRELKSPLFIFMSNRDNITYNLCGFNSNIRYPLVLDPIFSKQPFDVLGANKISIINDRNIYTDIENFLWEMKTEPVCEPSNNTKIINAGFDLKTSFRKM